MAIINPGNCLPKKIDENVVCVGVANLGTVETNWGTKHQIEFVFESEATRDSGYRVNRRQRCNVSFHEKATLLQFLETWVGRKLEDSEKCLNFALRQVGRQAELTIKPAQVGDKVNWNITAVGPSHGDPVAPSGEYRTRKQWDEYRRAKEASV